MSKNKQKIFRTSIDSKEKSSEAKILEKKIKGLGFNVKLRISNIYTIKYNFSDKQIKKVADVLHNKIVQKVRINQPFKEKFNWVLELGFLPGVTDNVANTTTEIINDLLMLPTSTYEVEDSNVKVFTSKVLFITSKNLKRKDIEKIAQELINDLIMRYHIKNYKEYKKNKGMDYIVPEVHLKNPPKAMEINLNINNDDLKILGKKGILDPDTKIRRGPLALDFDYLEAIKKYFNKKKRKPTDIELESIAQTWSEHCKHTYFAAQLDDIKEGIYKTYIKKATNKIRQKLGKKDFCISVFKDNSGGIVFDKDYMITDKVETHNSPSALDPFGGAITGIVGVNRDTIGFGLGAKPIANRYGFCIGKPEDKSVMYRGKNKTNPALSPRKILEGIIEGVNVGGNCSGIPTPQGFVYFDDCYKGKPLVFVGTIGLIPRRLKSGRLSHKKKAKLGDNIVIIGGRVGKDGIHGATFSSEALTQGSPATAVQIGDPITQKKLSDAVIKEARDRNLYNSITDNGAGGLSCSVAEMAQECGGFIVDLEKVPLKYPGLQPWEIWISESQERMTLAVPDNKLAEFNQLMKSRGVESTNIGKFNKSKKAIVKFKGKKILNLDMKFLHNGLPKRYLKTKPYLYNKKESEIKVKNQNKLLEKILGSLNNSSFEFISQQYDHEVQNSSIIKPLQGKGRVNNQATVIKPLFNSDKGVVLSQSLYPRLSEISTYDMAACTIDTAIRNCVAVGGNIDHLALLDNFCWCSSGEPERLVQLKDATKACYDYAVEYKTPFISGKDSMFNDFKGFDEKNNPLKISVLPTLLISSIGVINDIYHTTTVDFKNSGDLIYIIGNTKDECGGSEFYNTFGKIGGNAPKVNAREARKLYEKMYKLHIKELLSACMSVSRGGLLVGLVKMAIAGRLGAKIDINKIPNDNLSVEKIFYSETQSRFIVTINARNKKKFEKQMQGFVYTKIGRVLNKTDFVVTKNNKIPMVSPKTNQSRILDRTKSAGTIIKNNINNLETIYKKRFKNY